MNDGILRERDERGGYIVPLPAKVMTTDAWLDQHRGHGDLSQEDVGHPDGTQWNLVCACGAKHRVCR